MRIIFVYFAGLIVLSGCAGPMTPFGAVDLFTSWTKESADREPSSESAAGVRIRFSPKRQNLHDQTDFSVVIEDPEGFKNGFQFHLNYNGIDISKNFLNSARRSFLDVDRHRLKLQTHHLRLLPNRDNEIKVTYRHSAGSQSVIAYYLPPSCSAFERKNDLKSIPRFNPPARLIGLINQYSALKSLNPYYVAGLIAQESAFDPLAVSKNRALGLTQITSASEAEILKENPSLPRYSGIEELPLPILRLEVLAGRINSENEWRLNPELSIQGGVSYLAELAAYWSHPEKRLYFEQKLGTSDQVLSELILASYNWGPTRVSQAIDRSGPKWMLDGQLEGTRAYVGRVISFCDHFASQEGEK